MANYDEDDYEDEDLNEPIVDIPESVKISKEDQEEMEDDDEDDEEDED